MEFTCTFISYNKKPNKAEVTIEDMNLNKKESSLSYPIIVDGILYNDTLIKLNLSENWLREHLSNLSINSVEDVFFASINMKKELHVSLKKYIEDNNPIIPLYN